MKYQSHKGYQDYSTDSDEREDDYALTASEAETYDESDGESEGSETEEAEDSETSELLNLSSISLLDHTLTEAELGNLLLTKRYLFDILERIEPEYTESECEVSDENGSDEESGQDSGYEENGSDENSEHDSDYETNSVQDSYGEPSADDGSDAGKDSDNDDELCEEAITFLRALLKAAKEGVFNLTRNALRYTLENMNSSESD